MAGAPSASSSPSSSASAQVLALLDSLRPEQRHVFLRPSDALPTGALGVVRETLEGLAGQVGERQQQRLKESRAATRKRKREAGRDKELEVLKLRRVFVDGFETGQVWQQAKKIIGSVLDFSGGLLDEMEESEMIVADGLQDEVESEDLEEEEEEEEDVEDEDDEEDTEGLEMLEDEEEDGLEEEEEEDDDDDEDVDEEFVQDPNGLNDGFFSIDDFNKQTQWFEDQDARGDPNTDRASDDEDVDWDADPLAEPTDGAKKNKKKQQVPKRGRGDVDDEDAEMAEDSDDEDDGPTFGDMALDAPEGESEDEGMDGLGNMDGDEADDFNANEVYYKDFFAPPPRKGAGAGPRPKKAVRFEAQPPPAQEDVERAMADVRRDLFDDESDNEASEDALSDVSAGNPKSRRSAHERRQAKLAEEIRRLEAASVAKREWTLSGEAAAADRPVNSLLEEDLDFEHVGKPVPVITPEVTEGIEDLIKRRILAQQFDEVLRRRPGVETGAKEARRGMVELDDSKATKSLAEIYEEEHVKNANPDTYVSASDEKLQKEEREIEAMWKSVCAGLDALSSWHYRPKPAAPTLSVVADVAAVSMEDAQPSTGLAVLGEGSRMAPQEIYKPGAAAAPAGAGGEGARGEVVTSGGMPLARQELTREDKLRRRRREKERARKAGAEAVAAAKGKKPLSGKAKMQQDTMAELKKGGVKVINKKGEITDIEGNKAKAAKVASSGNFKL
ncbi:U3 small nucleolar RNA-associated protein MPP10 [Escovopsis weberi]|uniref:U3 small nucleolar ribonucleoprotein protein MPP10 n=1 Tax=Escovopsis weberi TaxID=150374 RepID=A0A0M9VV42_ESCWE|nr:U3 small nucleolar RNA-associated protein MPP10 [Escovopsis weberi]